MIKREMDLRECCSAAGAVADEAAVTALMITWYLRFPSLATTASTFCLTLLSIRIGLISTLANARCQIWGTCARRVTHQSTWESRQTQKCICGQTVNASGTKNLPRYTKIHMFIHQVLPRDLCSPALVHGCWDTGEPHKYIHESWKVDGKHFSRVNLRASHIYFKAKVHFSPLRARKWLSPH